MSQSALLFYINTINGGGAARVILQLAHHFAEVGYRSVLVTSFEDAENEYEVPDNVIRLSIEREQLNQSLLMRNISRIRELRKICKQESPVAVISFMREPNFRSLIATNGLKTKRIISVRNDPEKEYKGRLDHWMAKRLLSKADGCVFQTEDAKAWFPESLQKKSRVILNDVKEEFFSVQRTHTKNVVSVGRLSKQKNHELLIRAYAKIAEKHPDQKLLIYGSGVLQHDLEELICALGMESFIKLEGTTNDVSGVLSRADVFVLSSDYEGMPNCLMEALAAGVPSISTDCPCGGPRTLIQNGDNGILVPVGNEAAMANAIDVLLSDKKNAENMGERAKIAARAYHPERIFEEWKKYIEEVILKP